MSLAPHPQKEDDHPGYMRLRWIAVAAILLVGLGIPLYSLYDRHLEWQSEVQRLADIQALIVSRYAGANPDSWMFKREYLAIHLKGIRPEAGQTVIEYEGKSVMELGNAVAGDSIAKARDFSVHGKPVGRVRAIQPIGDFEKEFALTIGFAALVTGFLLWLLSYTVTGPLAAAVRERERLTRELAESARTDFLTGISNRREFVRLSELAIRAAFRYEGTLSLLMLDVDHFKNINDEYGHNSGDAVLVRLAEICRQMLRDIDVLGRVGGEEFAILLPSTPGESAFQIANRLRHRLADEAVMTTENTLLRFTVSIGVAELTRHDANLDVLIARADQALYQAKRTGRNKVCVAATEPPRKQKPGAHDPQSTVGA